MLKLRPYKNCDAETIASWATEEKGFYQWSAGRMGTYPFHAEDMRQFSRSIVDNDSIYQMTAFDENGIVGYMTMRYTDTERRILRFGFVIIDPARRNSGVGKAMLKLALRYAFEFLGAGKVTLGVFENNKPAYYCYRAAGFMDVELETEEKYEINGESWTCLELEAYPENEDGFQKVTDYPEEKMINEIIEKNSFRYAFQPIVEASTGKIFGYEALMRGEMDGLISPDILLDAAGRYNRLYDIEKATFFNVIDKVMKQKEEFGDRKIFVNSLPGALLSDAHYGELLARFGTDCTNLVVEITETTELSADEWTLLQKRSKEQHFELAIDDYGSGYANTTNLLLHMPNYVKIDKMLITDIDEDSKKQHFVKSMIDFAHANGFMALAEGVDTARELKMVIQLGIDLIQGFYLAKPSYDILQEIDNDVRSEMTNVGIKEQMHSGRKIYPVNGEKELPLMRLALEQNTGILIAQPEFKLVGNTNYTATMSVKIKDDTDCRLTFQNVFLEGFRELPCIEIGKNSHVTLILEGENKFQKTGIYVPESSSLTIDGAGDLQIRAQGVQGYGIGNTSDAGFGEIEIKGSGFVDVLVEADEGIGIGGGFQHEGKGIKLLDGVVRIEPASEHAIGVGSYMETVPIEIRDTKVQIDLRVGTGVGVGCMRDKQDILIKDSQVTVIGSGSALSGVGSNQGTGGSICLEDAEIAINLTGQNLNLLGSSDGELDICAQRCNIELRGEGAHVMALGTRDKKAKIKVLDSESSISIRSGHYILFGASDENVSFKGGSRSFKTNE